MEYSEKALSVDEQVELLLSKGLAADMDMLTECLTNVSYHRLGGYWHTFKQYNEDGSAWRFRDGTDFADVWDRYVFDRQFRLLVFDAIERVEVAIRNDLILNVAVGQGPFGYLEPATLPNIEAVSGSGDVLYSHSMLLGHIKSAVKREMRIENPDVLTFTSGHPESGEYLPYWMLLEVVDFGTLVHFFHGLPTNTKSRIARRYGLKRYSVLASWLEIIRFTRNRSAHQARLWNRRNIMKPEIPNLKNPQWHEPVDIELVKDRAFGTLTILKYMLGYVAPQSGWAGRLEALFARHPNIDRRLLGYPDNWQECPIWSASWSLEAE